MKHVYASIVYSLIGIISLYVTNFLVLYNCSLVFCEFLQLGGVTGDIEGMPYVEAFRQFQFKIGHSNICIVHVSLIPQVSKSIILPLRCLLLKIEHVLYIGYRTTESYSKCAFSK